MLAIFFAVILVNALTLRASVDVLSPIGSLPARLVGQMREPAAFVETTDGRYLVFDRRGQNIFSVDAKKTTLKKVVAIGPSDGEILRPLQFAMSGERTFTVLDNPGNYERIQTFYDTGTPLSVFRRFPERGEPVRVKADGSLSAFGAITAIGTNLLAHLPDTAALISEVEPTGRIVRRVGELRPTGFEQDAALHRALNDGIPLASPDGSLYFVFTTGVPMFRKYSPTGALLYERHVEGPELDSTLRAIPNAWPTRKIGDKEFPNVGNTVLTAAVDPQGRLWISLAVPATYVYDPDGNKTRTVQFRGAGVISPTSFFFAKDARVLVTPGCYEFDAK